MNKSNFIHAAYAVAFQAIFALVTGDWLIGAALAIGFFVGVEWMQEIRIKLQGRGIRWPYPVSPRLAIEGFMGWGRDRYMDILFPLVAVMAVAFVAGAS